MSVTSEIKESESESSLVEDVLWCRRLEGQIGEKKGDSKSVV